MSYLNISTKQTPQSEPILGANQVPNSAGGFVWAVDDWKRLDRFLILGAEDGTYYIGERALVVENAEAVIRCIEQNGLKTVHRICEISKAGRAPKNDPALFALALASALGDAPTRCMAFQALPEVARTGTHLTQFLNFRQAFAGWGRGMKRAVARWHLNKEVNALAYDLIKYRQRNGWTRRDILRKAHPNPTYANPEMNALFKWVVDDVVTEGLPRIVEGFLIAQQLTDPDRLASVIRDYRLPREALPTEALNHPSVWYALLDAGMKPEALVRNLAKMTSVGVITPFSDAVKIITSILTDQEALIKARLHPVKILAALLTYRMGHGEKGHLMWKPHAPICDALDQAFYLAFKAVEPTNKNIMLALDVSGSMGHLVQGIAGLSCREGAAAMALVTAAAEPNHYITAFANGGTGKYAESKWGNAYRPQMIPLSISPRMRMDTVVAEIQKIPMGGTNCALPMLDALEKGYKVDTFVIYTDNETWHGQIHPAQALQQYRREINPEAKLVVVAMEATKFSIADPNDAGMMDVVGFDTDAPAIIADFGR